MQGWQPVGVLYSGRKNHTATLLRSGFVLISCGLETNNLHTAELYNPDTNLWIPTKGPSLGREGHTATLLPDGHKPGVSLVIRSILHGIYMRQLNWRTVGFWSSEGTRLGPALKYTIRERRRGPLPEPPSTKPDPVIRQPCCPMAGCWLSVAGAGAVPSFSIPLPKHGQWGQSLITLVRDIQRRAYTMARCWLSRVRRRLSMLLPSIIASYLIRTPAAGLAQVV